MHGKGFGLYPCQNKKPFKESFLILPHNNIWEGYRKRHENQRLVTSLKTRNHKVAP